MPDYCKNELIVSGANVTKVLDFINNPDSEDEDEQIFDFNKLIPYPEEFASADKRAAEYGDRLFAIDKDAKDNLKELALLNQEYGFEPDASSCPDGYNHGSHDWCVDHLGTKWSTISVVLSQAPDRAVLNYDTAWAPPLPVIQQLAETFPGYEFDFQYFEGGMGFCGQLQYKNGKEVMNISDDYDGPRGC